MSLPLKKNRGNHTLERYVGIYSRALTVELFYMRI